MKKATAKEFRAAFRKLSVKSKAKVLKHITEGNK
jgi:hypothetical protein